ncbi:MAG: amidohydrolase family protein [Novosphingobium sp.]|nr:amidohydrolase family protein [Novosphingobium sp.]
MHDLAIMGGTVIDGTGAARYAANVYVKDGRIASVTSDTEQAREVIDATGLIVSPGFLDVHTHYDAQAFWDPTLSPSSFHGVTTVFGGFCGFSIAPLTPETAPYLMPMLARVEGMPIESLEAGVPWDWESFGDYLGKLQGKLAINAGFLCGHSALRRKVMGERAVGDHATQAEIDAMKALLREAIGQGALGFSTSLSETHFDGNADPVPSRHATMDEVLQLYAVLPEFEGTIAEIAPPSLNFTPETYEILTSASLAARRPVNWNLMSLSQLTPDEYERVEMQLGASDHAEKAGARVVGLTLPQTPRTRVNFVTGTLLNTMPEWGALFKLPLEARKAALLDPEWRERLKAGAAQMTGIMASMGNFGAMKVASVDSEENRAFEGRLVGEIAAERGRDAFDMFVAIALADDLKTVFMPGFRPDKPEAFPERAKLWLDNRTVVGGSDAGAHLDMIDTFAITTELIGSGAREHGAVTLEEAVHQVTLKPAMFMGLKHRGQIAAGWHADLVLFDPESIGAGETYMREDLPGGGARLYADANGIAHVIVGGTEIIRNGEWTGATPGTILKPGESTRTVPIPADEKGTTYV